MLIVDDNYINLRILEKMLAHLGVEFIKTASSGESALEILQEGHEFDMVLTDIQMPPGEKGPVLSIECRTALRLKLVGKHTGRFGSLLWEEHLCFLHRLHRLYRLYRQGWMGSNLRARPSRYWSRVTPRP